MTDHEKAAGVLDTPPTARDSRCLLIVDVPPLARNEFDDLRARFARRGWWLQRVRRADDGRTTYHLTRNTQARVFGHPHDLAGFLAVVEGWSV